MYQGVCKVCVCCRLSRSERDSSQKRTLLEDQRSRVKQALETARADAESLVSMRGDVAQLIVHLTRYWSGVISSPIKGSCYLLEQETLPSMLSTGWFQEWI